MQAGQLIKAKNTLQKNAGKKVVGRKSLKTTEDQNTPLNTNLSKDPRRNTVTVYSESFRNNKEIEQQAEKDQEDTTIKTRLMKPFSFKDEAKDDEKLSEPVFKKNPSTEKPSDPGKMQDPKVQAVLETIESNRMMNRDETNLGQRIPTKHSNIQYEAEDLSVDRRNSKAASQRSSFSIPDKPNALRNDLKSEISLALNEHKQILEANKSYLPETLNSARSSQGEYLTEKLTRLKKPSDTIGKYLELRRKEPPAPVLETKSSERQKEKEFIQKRNLSPTHKEHKTSSGLIISQKVAEEMKRLKLSTIKSSLLLFNNSFKTKSRRDLEVQNTSKSFREETKNPEVSAPRAQRWSLQEIYKSLDTSRAEASKSKTPQKQPQSKPKECIRLSPDKTQYKANRIQETNSSTVFRNLKASHSIDHNGLYNRNLFSQLPSLSEHSKQHKNQKRMTQEEFEEHYRKMTEFEQKRQVKVESLRREQEQTERSRPKFIKINRNPTPAKIDKNQAFHERIERFAKRKEDKLERLRKEATEDKVKRETSELTFTPKINKYTPPSNSARTYRPVVSQTSEKGLQTELMMPLNETRRLQAQKIEDAATVRREEELRAEPQIESKKETKPREQLEQNVIKPFTIQPIAMSSAQSQKVNSKEQHDAFMSSVLSKLSLGDHKVPTITRSIEVERPSNLSLITPKPVINYRSSYTTMTDERINSNMAITAISPKTVPHDSRPETTREFYNTPKMPSRQALTARVIAEVERAKPYNRAASSTVNARKIPTSAAKSEPLNVKSPNISQIQRESPSKKAQITKLTSNPQEKNQEKMERFYFYLSNRQSSTPQYKPKTSQTTDKIKKSENISYDKSSIVVKNNGDISFEKPQKGTPLTESRYFSFNERPSLEATGKKALADKLVQEFLNDQAKTTVQTDEKRKKGDQKITVWR